MGLSRIKLAFPESQNRIMLVTSLEAAIDVRRLWQKLAPIG